ncbi:HET-domain-containing protein [Thozetella sp. PMI_491]|nr:HET-domain-containing protein [Thozetella sp. PMI_491]
MRLLHASTLKFQDFNESEVPEYAILSHTWKSGEEVSYGEMSSGYLPTKHGYAKITEACRLALEYGVQFAWVDTCCINKDSSAELTESINSMFRWYQRAKVCLVYLADLDPTTETGQGLASCRWLRRGWTLQEMLAPTNVKLYDQAWCLRGSKHDYAANISEITGIPSSAICGFTPIKWYSAAQKMAWASQRETSRTEDIAYCLLGLFDVNMPLIYGEGPNAFQVDLSLFSWQPAAGEPQEPFCSLLASSPAEFRDCYDIRPYKDEAISGYGITNKGLKISTYLNRFPLPWSDSVDDCSLTFAVVAALTLHAV